MKHVKHYKRSFDRNHSISDRKRFLPDKTCERNPFIGKRTEARYIAYLLPMEQTILSTRGGGKGKTDIGDILYISTEISTRFINESFEKRKQCFPFNSRY